ncbi:MAG: hypothetical protein IKA54_05690 [Clostridia bacterium]|nr:hypothetical protein [Clostridia bacterium]
MKILTKNWAEKYEQVRLIRRLKQFDANKLSYEEINNKSIDDFYNEISSDEELKRACLDKNVFDKLYQAKVEQNRKLLFSLPNDIFNAINDIKSVILGYANKQDKKFLTFYAEKILTGLEKEAEQVKQLNESVEDCLHEEFILDEVVGELVYEEYSSEKNYYINIGGLVVCIENYQILEREDFKINKWDTDNPLSLWTALYAGELHYGKDDNFELHLLLVDGDKYANKKYWYFTLRGSNVKFVNN